MVDQRWLILGFAATGAVTMMAGAPTVYASAPETAIADSNLVIPAGQTGADFGAFTVEGEDRIHIEFERPALQLTLDPRSVGGLNWSNPNDILERRSLDTTTPFLRAGTTNLSRYPARPWARTLVLGDVVRFRPKLEDAAEWHLTISDAAGREVSRYGGEGDPPKEIVWDGMTILGRPAWPGQTYVHAIDVEDPAGNRRRFNGKEFVMPAFAVARDDSIQLVVAGGHADSDTIDELTVLELADWVNQHAAGDTEVRIESLARSYSESESMARSARDALASVIAGNPARLRTISRVDPTAPARGVLTVQFRTGATPPESRQHRR